MRGLALVLVVVLLGAGGASLALGRDDDTGPARGAVSLVGDSLNVGIEPYLADELPGWTLDADDVVGRSTGEGLEALAGAGASLAPRVVVSLGTNDPAGDVEGFARDVREAMASVGPRRCVVWATVRRDGDAYEPFNDVLRAEADTRSNLVLVDWAGMVGRDPSLLAADGVHGTAEGYAARAAAVADAVRSCRVGAS